MNMDCMTTFYSHPPWFLEIETTSRGLSAIHFSSRDTTIRADSRHVDNPLLQDIVDQLDRYFQGHVFRFHLPLDFSGTRFQQRVWSALQDIPYGQTWSYQTVANHISNPKAVRAVGQANSANPIPIIIPCHRVIRADGSLGGYGSGVTLKRDLLRLEGYSP